MENFAIFTDSSSNITPDLAHEANIGVIPLTCMTKEADMPCYDDTVEFDGHSFYEALRETGPVKTSMVNISQFRQAFEPVIKAGQDILYVAMSGGISGTCAAAREAAAELMKAYPGRVIRVVDTLAASFEEGIFALKASVMRKAKVGLDAAVRWAEENKRRMCQFFTADDLICEEDADYLAALLKKKRGVKDVLIRCYEPGTGSHVGPGAVALFFFSPIPCK